MLQILTHREKNEAFLLPRQPEPKPLKPAAVKLLGPPCLFAKTTLLQASVIPHRFLKLCVRRENESAQRRCLPLSDGERYRGCTAAQRRITWPRQSGINTHTHTHSRAIFPARTLSLLTRAHSLLARACSLFYFRAKNKTKKVQALRLTEKNKSPSISHD